MLTGKKPSNGNQQSQNFSELTENQLIQTLIVPPHRKTQLRWKTSLQARHNQKVQPMQNTREVCVWKKKDFGSTKNFTTFVMPDD